MIKVVTTYEGIKFLSIGAKQLLFVVANLDGQKWAKSIVDKLDSYEIGPEEFITFFDKEISEFDTQTIFEDGNKFILHLTNGGARLVINPDNTFSIGRRLEDNKYLFVNGSFTPEGELKIGNWSNVYSISKRDIEFVLSVFNEIRYKFDDQAPKDSFDMRDVPKIILVRALIHLSNKLESMKSSHSELLSAPTHK